MRKIRSRGSSFIFYITLHADVCGLKVETARTTMTTKTNRKLQNNVRPGMTAEISVFSVYVKILSVMEQLWCPPVDLGPAVANDRSPTVTRHDGRTASRLEDDERRLHGSGRHVTDADGLLRQVLRCSAAESSIDKDRYGLPVNVRVT